MTPRQMQRVLVGLRTRVTQEHSRQRVRAELHQFLGQRIADRVWYRGGVEQKLSSLLRHRTNHLRMTVSGGSHGMPAICVEPLRAVLIDQPGSPAPYWENGELGVDRKEGRRPDRRCLQHGNIPVEISPAHS